MICFPNCRGASRVALQHVESDLALLEVGVDAIVVRNQKGIVRDRPLVLVVLRKSGVIAPVFQFFRDAFTELRRGGRTSLHLTGRFS